MVGMGFSPLGILIAICVCHVRLHLSKVVRYFSTIDQSTMASVESALAAFCYTFVI